MLSDKERLITAVGPGWRAILKDLLWVLPSGIRIVRVTVRFGRLRIYPEGSCEHINTCVPCPCAEAIRLIKEAEQEAAKTCTECGTRGLMRRVHDRHVVLCSACNEMAHMEGVRVY